jgi:anti-sigma-K factor RskA
MNPMDINEIRDLLPAYALGAVEPGEREQIEAALAVRPELREELASYTPVLEALALSVPQVQPPSDLGARILRQAAPRVFPWRPFVAAAAVLVAVLGGVLIWQLSNQDDHPDEDPVTDIMENPDSSHIELTLLEESADFAEVEGEFVVAPGNQQAVLTVANLLPQPSGMAYQLWFVRDGERVSGGVFKPEAVSPENPLLIQLPEDFVSYQWLGITIEPEYGSPEPTGSAILGVELKLSPDTEE